MSPGGRSDSQPSGAPAAPATGPWLAAALAALVAVGLGYAAFQALRAPEVAFLQRREPARWILHPLRPGTNIRGTDQVELAAEFRRRFALDAPPSDPVHVRVRAFRSFRLSVNGRSVGASDPGDGGGSWKDETRLAIGDALRAGENEISVAVTGRYGPPALWLASEGLPDELRTGPDWTVTTPDGVSRAAPLANDTVPWPPSFQGPRPAAALAAHGPLLLGVLALSTALFAVLARVRERGAPPAIASWLARPDRTVLGVAIVAWVALALHNAGRGSIEMGFDAPSHLAYVRHLLEHGALRPTDRATFELWEYHQPPLFYALAALVQAAARGVTGPDAAERWVRIVPLAAGLGQVVLTAVAARWLLPGATARAAAVALAALVPMNVYVSHYVSNESLSAVGIGAALTLGIVLSVRERPGPRSFLALGIVCGLALLAKATFLMILPVVLGVVGAKLLGRDRMGLPAVGGRLALALATALAVGGWFYLRSWIAFGTPLVLPWEGGMGVEWWQDPGYHTARWFTGFGGAFSHPFFAGTYSFLDSLYATFWGDAFVGGRVGFGRGQPPWDFGFMAALYPLAAPATLLFAVGVVRGVGRMVREPSPAWLLVLAAVACSGLSLLLMNLRVPYYAQAKSFYALGALLPLALLGGAGYGWIEDALRRAGLGWARPLLRGYLATLAFAVLASFRAVPGP